MKYDIQRSFICGRMTLYNFEGVNAVEAEEAVGFGQVAVGVEVTKAVALSQAQWFDGAAAVCNSSFGTE